MIKALLVSGFLALSVGEASAALSGFYDSSRILHAIIGRGDIADALKQQPIESITRTESGFQIKSRDCAVDALVERKRAAKPGPGGFRIVVGRGECR